MKRLVTMLILSASCACTTIHSAYLSNLSKPATGAKKIEADSSKTVFFGMNFSNDYVFEARERLYEQCKDGMVTGVLSTYESRNYFIARKHVVRARGFCVRTPKPLSTVTATTAELLR